VTTINSTPAMMMRRAAPPVRIVVTRNIRKNRPRATREDRVVSAQAPRRCGDCYGIAVNER
jgi:hypothetical protein